MVKRYQMDEASYLIKTLTGIYDVVRIVDPNECRVIMTEKDKVIRYGDTCYHAWEQDDRCRSCSSYFAYITGAKKKKNCQFQGDEYQVDSIPLELIQKDGSVLPCILELIEKTTKETPLQAAGEQQKEMQSVAEHDRLTHAYRAEGFYKSVRETLEGDASSSYLMLSVDIKHFKLVNELFGRRKGNEVLIRMAETLLDIVRENGIVGRINGDNFAVFMREEDFHEDEFYETVAKLGELFDSDAFRLQIRIGVYRINRKNQVYQAVCSMYDRAKMAARREASRGTGKVFWFDDEDMHRFLNEQRIISGFEKTLGVGRFQIYLQPHALINGKTLGAEALVRWVRADDTIMLPNEFIGILEKSDLIARLDRNVWEQTAALLAKWKLNGRDDLYISVNISPLDFYYMDVHTELCRIADAYGIDRSRMHLEVTETSMLKDNAEHLREMEKLRTDGFQIGIDDFGQGYSSLALLKNLKVDFLKLDMDFIHETQNDEKSRMILQSMLTLTQGLKIDVIAEGVETRQQLFMLEDMGCMVYQGFYFSRPIPVEQFEERYL